MDFSEHEVNSLNTCLFVAGEFLKERAEGMKLLRAQDELTAGIMKKVKPDYKGREKTLDEMDVAMQNLLHHWEDAMAAMNREILKLKNPPPV